MSKLTSRFNFQQAAERLGITTDDLRSLVVEMPRQLPAIYVTQVGYAEPYEYQLLKVDSMGRAFDMSVGGIDGTVHTGFLRIERVALEKFILDKGLTIISIGSQVNGNAGDAPLAQSKETQEQRQGRYLQACIDAGLPMNERAALKRLPDGVGKVAKSVGVTRQAFSADLKAALKHREIAQREGGIARRA